MLVAESPRRWTGGAARETGHVEDVHDVVGAEDKGELEKACVTGTIG